METPLVEHLEELRRRLVICLVAVAVGTVIGFALYDPLMSLLLRLIENVPDVTVQAIEVPEQFTTSMRLALTAGIALAMPVIAYQVWQFLRPGLYVHEKRFILVGLPLITLFFAAGVTFAYMLALPAALRFLLRFGSEQVETQPQLGSYLSFVSTLLLWSGISFETPIFLFFLAKVGVVDAKRLGRWRRYAFLVICILAAVITPTPDPVNMMIVAVPLYLLYELGILMARFA
jgi:sec-independent protein translocase protein TatC